MSMFHVILPKAGDRIDKHVQEIIRASRNGSIGLMATSNGWQIFTDAEAVSHDCRVVVLTSTITENILQELTTKVPTDTAPVIWWHPPVGKPSSFWSMDELKATFKESFFNPSDDKLKIFPFSLGAVEVRNSWDIAVQNTCLEVGVSSFSEAKIVACLDEAAKIASGHIISFGQLKYVLGDLFRAYIIIKEREASSSNQTSSLSFDAENLKILKKLRGGLGSMVGLSADTKSLGWLDSIYDDFVKPAGSRLAKDFPNKDEVLNILKQARELGLQAHKVTKEETVSANRRLECPPGACVSSDQIKKVFQLLNAEPSVMK